MTIMATIMTIIMMMTVITIIILIAIVPVVMEMMTRMKIVILIITKNRKVKICPSTKTPTASLDLSGYVAVLLKVN